MMLNVRRTLWSIFGILFIFSITPAAFAQQSDTDKIIQEIHRLETKMVEKINELETNTLKGMHELETKMRDHVDKKIGELDTKFHELDKKVALVDLKANILIGVFGVIITLVVIPILVPVLKQVVLNRLNLRKNNGVPSGPQPEAERILKQGNFGDRA